MAFQKDKTGAKQTAINAAATVTAALVSAGVIKSASAAMETMAEVRDSIFEDIAVTVDADNAMFRENDTGSTSKSGGRGGNRKSGGNSGRGGSISLSDARGTDLKFGAFKGLTLGEVVKMTEDDADEYGYKGSGKKYIRWLASEQNENDYMRRRAQVIIDAARSSSDEDRSHPDGAARGDEEDDLF